MKNLSLFTFIFSLAAALAASADTYTLRGTRFLRKYTAPQSTQVYLAETDAQRIANSLCDVPWTESPVADATASSHVTTNLDANVANREKFDAAIFCADHAGDEHVAYANAAVYRFEFPSAASLPSVTNLSLNVYSDPYNVYGARISVIASNSDAIPTDCATVRGDVQGGVRAANVARRVTRTSGGTDYWYPAMTNLAFAAGDLLPEGGLQLKRYLYVFVLMENYATSRGNWLEGCAYIDNAVKIKTTAPVPGWGASVGGCDIAEPYATRYHLKDGNADKDFDGDGLSNYAEYLISEVFQFARLDPDDPKTDGSCVDFFRRKGDMYLGEIFMGYKDPGVPSLGLAEPLKLHLRYREKRRVKAPVVVHAWNVARDPDMSGDPDRVMRVGPMLINGEHDAEAATVPDAGLETVLKGRVRFVAFADENGSGAFDPGEPFAYWEGDAGHCRHAVALTDESPVFARVDMAAGTSDRERWRPGGGGVTDISGSEYADLRTRLGVTRTTLAGNSGKVRVRVVRALVDHSDTMGNDQQQQPVRVTQTVVMDKRLDLAARSYLHEGDFLADGSFDVDWNCLSSEIAGRPVLATSVSYMIVIGEGGSGLGQAIGMTSNTIYRCLIDRAFDLTVNTIRPRIDATQPGMVYGACPTFRWVMRDDAGNAYNSYSAFRIVIGGYDSGIRVAPARDDDGWYGWTLDEPIGTFVRTSGTYDWTVTMYNAKFVNGSSSATGTLVVNLNNQQEMNDHGYSSIAAAVKYTGPAVVLSRMDGTGRNGLVRLEAFAAGDFSGTPAGAAIVYGAGEMRDASIMAKNANVYGLPEDGTYYLRAFVDLNGNGKKDDFEPWGAAKEPVALSKGVVTSPTVGIYVEDADTDRDCIPDAFEYASVGFTGVWSSVKRSMNGSVKGDDRILFRSPISTAGISTGLSGASLTIFQNTQSFIVTELGMTNVTAWISDIRDEAAENLHPNEAGVTGVSLSPDGTKAEVHFGGYVTDVLAGKLLGLTYDLGTRWSRGVATVKVYGKDTLATAGWTEIGTYTNAFDRGDASVAVPLGSGLDMTNGYYKVEVTGITNP